MKKSEFVKSLSKVKEDFYSVLKDFYHILGKELKMEVEDFASNPGCQIWVIKQPDKKVYLKLYATGEIIVDCLDKLSDAEKTSLDTSNDFLEPNMEQTADNCFDLNNPEGLKNLFKEIKEHFSLVYS